MIGATRNRTHLGIRGPTDTRPDSNVESHSKVAGSNPSAVFNREGPESLKIPGFRRWGPRWHFARVDGDRSPGPRPVERRRNGLRGAGHLPLARTARRPCGPLDIGNAAFKKLGDRADTLADRIVAMGDADWHIVTRG